MRDLDIEVGPQRDAAGLRNGAGNASRDGRIPYEGRDMTIVQCTRDFCNESSPVLASASPVDEIAVAKAVASGACAPTSAKAQNVSSSKTQERSAALKDYDLIVRRRGWRGFD